jgi:hypothetical protein
MQTKADKGRAPRLDLSQRLATGPVDRRISATKLAQAAVSATGPSVAVVATATRSI